MKVEQDLHIVEAAYDITSGRSLTARCNLSDGVMTSSCPDFLFPWIPSLRSCGFANFQVLGYYYSRIIIFTNSQSDILK